MPYAENIGLQECSRFLQIGSHTFEGNTAVMSDIMSGLGGTMFSH